MEVGEERWEEEFRGEQKDKRKKGMKGERKTEEDD